LQGTGILRAVSTNAQTQQRARGKLTVSEPPTAHRRYDPTHKA
jgi:hypothetical protein